ncbi:MULTISPECIES: efflux RND transporter periplasmic adaptor subunit [Bacillus]|uniref:efflux RND transporter periplasmic adaptor subunit n=1 Tax=Bacillus TaxID=1386 RepID=UPI000BB94045|nr:MULTISPECIES: efflux RND transporter periplasmic adaptor subunit [Bacillus]
MKGKLILSTFILIVLSGCIYGLFYFSSQSTYQTVRDVTTETKNTVHLRAEVYSGTLENVFRQDGKVVLLPEEIYMDQVEISWNRNDKVTLHVNLGDDLQAGDELYTVNKKTYYAESDVKVVNVSTDEKNRMTVINLLNYDKLYIETSFPYERIDSLHYETDVKVALFKENVTDADFFNGTIHRIGYQVEEGNTLNVLVKTDKKLLPGVKVIIKMELPKKEYALYTLKQMVKKNGDDYYVEVETHNGTVEKRVVEIGEFFSLENETGVMEYVELLSGVVEGEKLVTETINDN